MNKGTVFIMVLVLIFVATLPLFSLTSQADRAIKGVRASSDMQLLDNMVLETHYKKGDWSLQVTPAWFRISQSYAEESKYSESWGRSDDYSGLFGGLSFNYAFTDAFLVFGSMSVYRSKGSFEVKDQTDIMGSTTVRSHFDLDMEFNSINLVNGYAYDAYSFFDSSLSGVSFFDRISMPVYTGIYVMKYNMKVDIAPRADDDYTPYITADDSAILPGYFFGMAMGYRITDAFKATVAFSGFTVSKLHTAEATVVADNPSGPNSYYPVGSTDEMYILGNAYGTYSLYLRWKSSSPWSISFNLLGPVSEMNLFKQVMLDKLKIRTISVTVAYSTF